MIIEEIYNLMEESEESFKEKTAGFVAKHKKKLIAAGAIAAAGGAAYAADKGYLGDDAHSKIKGLKLAAADKYATWVRKAKDMKDISTDDSSDGTRIKNAVSSIGSKSYNRAEFIADRMRNKLGG